MLTIVHLKRKLSEKFPNYEWTIPPNLKMGILTTNEAFKQAQQTKTNPAEKAIEIAEQIQNYTNSQKLPLRVFTTGPYININLTTTSLNKLLADGFDYTLPQKKDIIFIDFFSPNVGKQMHIGHMRSGNIGESLRRIFSLTHKHIITDNHLADWGIQFSILIWGIQNITSLQLPFSKINWDKTANEIVEDLNQLYIATNKYIEEHPPVREEAQQIAKKLERNITEEIDNKTEIYTIWYNIVQASCSVFSSGESYLELNVGYKTKTDIIAKEVVDTMRDTFGVWQINPTPISGQFDLVLGESYYQKFLSEVEYWYEQGLLIKEGKGYYMDLEDKGLGRAYLISSAGYSVYLLRDVLARFVWAGMFQADLSITIADNRQTHSFKQTFCVIKKILESNIYDSRNFGVLSQKQTTTAIEKLSKTAPIHLGFGFLSLPSGAMSTRKGTVVKFNDFIQTLEEKVDEVLTEKDSKIKKNSLYWEKVQKISVATIKWFDLSRDKNQDIIFNPEDMLKFEGNTGIYQLYTYARITNILKKNETTAQLNSSSINLLNDVEKEILLEIFTMPYVLEQAVIELKPHLIANHLISVTSKINSWYACYSVSGELDTNRRDSLLAFCRHIQKHLKLCLSLLGIEALEKL